MKLRLNRNHIERARDSDSSTSSVVTSNDLETTEDPVAVAESLPHSLAAAEGGVVAEEDEGGHGDEANGSELSRRHSSRMRRKSSRLRPTGVQQQQQQQSNSRALHPLDDFTKLLVQDDARLLVDLLKLAVTGKSKVSLLGWFRPLGA